MKITVVLLIMLWTTCRGMDMALERLQRTVAKLEQEDLCNTVSNGDGSNELSDRIPIDLQSDEPSMPLSNYHEAFDRIYARERERAVARCKRIEKEIMQKARDKELSVIKKQKIEKLQEQLDEEAQVFEQFCKKLSTDS